MIQSLSSQANSPRFGALSLTAKPGHKSSSRMVYQVEVVSPNTPGFKSDDEVRLNGELVGYGRGLAKLSAAIPALLNQINNPQQPFEGIATVNKLKQDVQAQLTGDFFTRKDDGVSASIRPEFHPEFEGETKFEGRSAIDRFIEHLPQFVALLNQGEMDIQQNPDLEPGKLNVIFTERGLPSDYSTPRQPSGYTGEWGE